MSDIPSLPPVESASPAPQPAASWRRPSVIIAAVALALLGWQWVETRSRLADLQEDLARRLADGDTAAKEARALARQAQENLQDLQAKVGALDARLSESQGQQVALETMYQAFSRSRDDRVLAEVEQAVSIAAQAASRPTSRGGRSSASGTGAAVCGWGSSAAPHSISRASAAVSAAGGAPSSS